MIRVYKIFIITVFIFGFLVSCGPVEESSHPLYIKAKSARNKSHYVESAKLFEEFLLVMPKSIKAHEELATLYHDHLDMPGKAIYHYDMYLKLAPESQEADSISKFKISAEKKYLEQLKKKFGEYEKEQQLKLKIHDLEEKNKKYIRFIKYLKAKSDALSQEFKKGTAVTTEKSSESVKTTSNKVKAEDSELKPILRNKVHGIIGIHVVEKGDNLMKISKQYYGTTRYYREIYEANKDKLDSESDLNIDQKLKIPKINKNHNLEEER